MSNSHWVSPTATQPTLHEPLHLASKRSSYIIMPMHWLPHCSQEAHASRLTFHYVLVPRTFTDISYCLPTLSKGLRSSPCLRSSPLLHQVEYTSFCPTPPFKAYIFREASHDLPETFCNLPLMQFYISLCDRHKILEPESLSLNIVHATD